MSLRDEFDAIEVQAMNAWLNQSLGGRKGAPRRGPSKPVTDVSAAEAIREGRVKRERIGTIPDEDRDKLAALQFQVNKVRDVGLQIKDERKIREEEKQAARQKFEDTADNARKHVRDKARRRLAGTLDSLERDAAQRGAGAVDLLTSPPRLNDLITPGRGAVGRALVKAGIPGGAAGALAAAGSIAAATVAAAAAARINLIGNAMDAIREEFGPLAVQSGREAWSDLLDSAMRGSLGDTWKGLQSVAVHGYKANRGAIAGYWGTFTSLIQGNSWDRAITDFQQAFWSHQSVPPAEVARANAIMKSRWDRMFDRGGTMYGGWKTAPVDGG